MLTLGIDPGSLKTGYALLRSDGRKISYVDSGVLRFNKIENFIDRLGIIHQSSLELIEKFSPDCIAIESLIYVKSIPALSKLAQARGAMIAAFVKTHQGKVFEYSPNLIKSSVSGHGHASKEGIQKTLEMIFGKISFKTSDESDAIAIALCHFLNNRNNKIRM